MRAFIKTVVVTTFGGSLVFGAMGCGGTEQESPSQEVLGIQTGALSETQTSLTAGECTVMVDLNRSGRDLVARCSSKCRQAGSVTLRLYLDEGDTGGSFMTIGFNVNAHSARLGGSTTITAASQPAGTYRAKCSIDYADSQQVHSGADVVAGPAAF